jgi:hypothetical protein
MKSVQFLGNSLKSLREFPQDVRHDAGRQIDRVQKGKQPDDFKPMPMRFTCCMPFRKKHPLLPNETSIPLKPDLPNY